ncbi:type II secretion system protein GspM [Neptuniibacter sp. QD72_48]|uniref:type II secretion system protein GspM n=1 Tax=unclassified Neptuniibacter TaxID=2630693 RepID=UPI0039F54922
MIKDYLNNLSSTEIRTLTIALPFVVLALCWLLIIKPTLNSEQMLYQQLDAKLRDYQWMQQAQYQVSASVNNAEQKQASNLRQSVHNAFSSQQIKLTRMNSVTEEEISFTLSNVAFNNVIKSITALENKGVTLTQIHITPAEDAGNINANLTFGK